MSKIRNYLCTDLAQEATSCIATPDFRKLADISDAAMRSDNDTIAIPLLMKLSNFYLDQRHFKTAANLANHVAYRAPAGGRLLTASISQLDCIAGAAKDAGDIKSAARALNMIASYAKPAAKVAEQALPTEPAASKMLGMSSARVQAAPAPAHY